MTRLAVSLSALALLCTACSRADAPPSEPEVLLANPETFGSRDRNYSLTESPDGTMRVFAAQRGDFTDLMIMRLGEAGWSAPERLDVPRLETVTTPHFSPLDGRLYFSTDAPHPGRPGRTDRNIWSAAVEADNTLSDLRPMSDDINTGAQEESPSFARDGTFYFSNDHTRHGGGFDIYSARPVETGGWDVSHLPVNTRMADTHVQVSPGGDLLVWYAHMPDVIGIVDLYYARREGEGWSTPANLGPFINTRDIDYGPGFSADGRTLFFSRQGEIMSVSLSRALELAEAGGS